MTFGEELYLALVLAVFSGFAAMLAWAAHVSPGPDHMRAPAKVGAPGQVRVAVPTIAD